MFLSNTNVVREGESGLGRGRRDEDILGAAVLVLVEIIFEPIRGPEQWSVYSMGSNHESSGYIRGSCQAHKALSGLRDPVYTSGRFDRC
jgi:hypothetical protein